MTSSIFSSQPNSIQLPFGDDLTLISNRWHAFTGFSDADKLPLLFDDDKLTILYDDDILQVNDLLLKDLNTNNRIRRP